MTAADDRHADNHASGFFRRHPIGTIVLVLLTLLISLPVVVYLHGRMRLAAVTARIRAAGQPLTWEEVLAVLPTIPDEQNMAVQIDKYATPIRICVNATSGRGEDLPLLGIRRSPAPGLRLDPGGIETSKQLLETNAPNVEGLMAAAELSEGQYPPPFDLDSHGVPALNDHVLTLHRFAVKTLCLKALVEANLNQANPAHTTLVALTRLDRALAKSPTLVAVLTRYACASVIGETAIRCVALADLSDMQLQNLQRQFEELEGNLSPAWAFRSEVGYNESSWERLADSQGGKPVFLLLSYDRALTLELMSRAADAAELPIQQAVAEIRNVGQERDGLPFYYPLTRIAISSPAHVAEAWTRAVAELRIARTTVAIKRFHLTHGRWPDRLDELVPEFMDRIPVDPSDGQPLRYTLTDTGLEIRSSTISCDWRFSDPSLDNPTTQPSASQPASASTDAFSGNNGPSAVSYIRRPDVADVRTLPRKI